MELALDSKMKNYFRLFRILAAILFVLVRLGKANDLNLDLHTIAYKRGNYSVDNILEVNQNKEYILSFPNTSVSLRYGNVEIGRRLDFPSSDHQSLSNIGL